MNSRFPQAPARLGLIINALVCAVALAACASPALREARELSLAGQHDTAYRVLQAASQKDPQDKELIAAAARTREQAIAQLATQADTARASKQWDAVRAVVPKMQAVDAGHPRLAALQAELDRHDRQTARLAKAEAALVAGKLGDAQALLQEINRESPGAPEARNLQLKLAQATPTPAPFTTRLAGSQKPVTIEFRDTPLRNVFDALGRTSNLNFVFDKEVRGDTKVTLALRDVTLDDALRILLASQQLERRVLNENTVFIHAATQAKQREYQELQSRTFYLANTDVKQAQNLIRTVAKSRDIFVDERLNLVVVRDTPESLQTIERLLATLDLPEPEVMLDVEVLELTNSRTADVGVQWVDQVAWGAIGGGTSVPVSDRHSFRYSIANPAAVATLRGSSGNNKLLANPRLRARNHEKARIQVGEKLPVFTTSAVANAGTSTSVSYLDTGLKLEVEPSVQLDNDVVIKVNLEVNNLINRVTGPQGAIAYQVGTRNASTSLRLRDGETQVLGGLINDDDRKSVAGMPWIADLPILGRLFGVHSDSRAKSEVVLLITPHVIRNVAVPSAEAMLSPGGVENNPAAESMRLVSQGRVSTPINGGSLPGGQESRPRAGIATVEMRTSEEAAVGDTVSVTLRNLSPSTVQGELIFDGNVLENTNGSNGNSMSVELAPMGQRVVILRVRTGANASSTAVRFDSAVARSPEGRTTSVAVDGEGVINIQSP